MGVQDKIGTVVSTKGQVILPKAIRERMHWSAGTKLTIEQTADGVLLKASPIFPDTTLDEVVGSMRYDGPPLSLEDMDAAVMREAKRRARR